jgi:hypothetical protein
MRLTRPIWRKAQGKRLYGFAEPARQMLRLSTGCRLRAGLGLFEPGFLGEPRRAAMTVRYQF